MLTATRSRCSITSGNSTGSVLAGIDAPEKGQPFGQRSKQHLAKLALGKEAKADCHKVDRYGRDVCNVYVNGKGLGLAQLDTGLAWWYRKYAHEQAPRDRVDYDAAEGRAGARIGPGYGRTRTRCRRGSGVTSIVKLRGRFSAMQRRGAYRGVGSLDS